MTRVLLVTGAWERVVDVTDPAEVIDVEGMTWQRDPDSAPRAPRYVPLVGG